MNLSQKNLFTYILIFVVSFSVFSCSNLKETPIENFEGDWELVGRSMFDGIKIKIEKKESGGLSGIITEINSNKYVNMFAEVGDVWVKGIKRSSNFEFTLTEKRIGASLFGLYGLGTSDGYKITFSDKNIIELKPGVFYKRILKQE